MRNERLARNFWLLEFLASDTAEDKGIDNVPDAGELANIRYTARRLQAIRDFLNASLDGPIRIEITSGFRNAALNAAVSGSATSDHRTGLAADFKAIRADGRAVSPRVLIRVVEDLGEFDQAIFYPGQTRIHVGYGPAMRRETLTRTASGYEPGVTA